MHGRYVTSTCLDIVSGYTRYHLPTVWGGWRLRYLNARILNAWIVELHRDGKLSSATINKLLQTIHAMSDQAVLDCGITYKLLIAAHN